MKKISGSTRRDSLSRLKIKRTQKDRVGGEDSGLKVWHSLAQTFFVLGPAFPLWFHRSDVKLLDLEESWQSFF